MLIFSILLHFKHFNFKIPDSSEQIFEQYIDHFSDDSRTFSQRYFVNDKFVKDSKNINSVIIWIGDESTTIESSVTNFSYVYLANETQSLLLSLEHRFFGHSFPFSSTSTEFLKYLTVDQALSDLAYFITEKVKYNSQKETFCSSSKCSIIVVGGSYSGSLSAWFRLKYPHLTTASWASSAPINVIDDFYQYDSHISDLYYEYSPQCYDTLHQLFSKLSPTQKSEFNFTGSDISFLYSVADCFSGPIQYQTKYPNLLSNICTKVQQEQSLVGAFKMISSVFGYEPNDYDPQNDFLKNTSIEGNPYVNLRSWSWMTCTQVGWFQTSVPSNLSIRSLRSSSITLNFFDQVCKNLFNISR